MSNGIWSRYNTLFLLERLGYFLYNALSNDLIQVDYVHFDALEKLRSQGIDTGSLDDRFISFLREHKVVVEEGEEERLLLARQYQRNLKCFNTSRLDLTICPTLQCNFRCPYCFEKTQQNSAIMAHKTIAQLLAFITSHKESRHLALAWYGGEPLIAFDVICELTEKIKSLDIAFEGAALITNGYLLDKRKCDLLNELNIHSVQITLDGPEELHDSRRFLSGGGRTFQRILANVDTLMNLSSYEGNCHIRVNIDKHNIKEYQKLCTSLLERFKGKKLFIYAGHIDTTIGHSYDHACSLNLREWTDFTLGMYNWGGLFQAEDFYPTDNIDSVCVATVHNRFVIDPEGYLYKCWEDVGKLEMVIGNIHDAAPISNQELRAQYSIGTDAYRDPKCLACFVLPICSGGCANKRLRTKQYGEPGLEFCSPYKDNLIRYLERYIDTFLSREICLALISSIWERPDSNGYRLISPGRQADRTCCFANNSGEHVHAADAAKPLR